MNKAAHGNQGNWFATHKGQKMPCVWETYYYRNHYCDEGIFSAGPKHRRYVEAFKDGAQVLLCGQKSKAGKLFRDGYVAVLTITNVRKEDGRLEFDVIGRRDLVKRDRYRFA
jgi:hypothetical protein